MLKFECPKCRALVLKRHISGNFECINKSCNFEIPGHLGGIPIDRDTALVLISGGVSQFFKFKIRGKHFTAALQLNKNYTISFAKKRNTGIVCQFCNGIVFETQNKYSCNNCGIVVSKVILKKLIPLSIIRDLFAKGFSPDFTHGFRDRHSNAFSAALKLNPSKSLEFLFQVNTRYRCRCGSPIIKKPDSFFCRPCGLEIPKTVFYKQLELKTIVELFQKHVTARKVRNLWTPKKKKYFDSRLMIDSGQVRILPS